MKLERIVWNGPSTPAEAALKRRLTDEGFDVMTWTDPPHRTYAPHRHDHHESLWCIRGAITFHIDGRDYHLDPGDRLMLPRNTLHGATAGRDGATYLIGETPR
jgi:quercetin dioxygenase-like cupin family protein